MLHPPNIHSVIAAFFVISHPVSLPVLLSGQKMEATDASDVNILVELAATAKAGVGAPVG
ncbi:hypothetical protein GCM10023187_08720 [Nibrella viscosa]|uniref:Uncharacterized protein n=1 Tax=Nibrella viscosa TaxID=1084524 RepID=A0ABP8JZV5_9BACT